MIIRRFGKEYLAKKCSKCHAVKVVSQFRKGRGICKDCTNLYQKMRREIKK